MVRFKFLLIVGTLAVLTLSAVPSTAVFAGSARCTPEEIRTGKCPSELVSGGLTNGHGVDVFAEGSTNSNGTGAATGPGGESDDANGTQGGSAGSQVRPTMCVSHKTTTTASQ